MIEWLNRLEIGEYGCPTSFFQIPNQLWKLQIKYGKKPNIFRLDFETLIWTPVEFTGDEVINVFPTDTDTFSDDQCIYLLQNNQPYKLWKFDITTLTCSYLFEFRTNNIKRSCFFNDKLYIVSGTSNNNVQSVDCYNNVQKRFDSIPGLANLDQIYFIDFFTLNNKLYIFLFENGNIAKIYHVCTTKNQIVLMHQEDWGGITRGHVSLWTTENRLNMFFNPGHSEKTAQLACFDFKTLNWSFVKASKCETHDSHLATFSIDNKILHLLLSYETNRKVYIHVGVLVDTLELRTVVKLMELYKKKIYDGEKVEDLVKEISSLKMPDKLRSQIANATIWKFDFWKWDANRIKKLEEKKREEESKQVAIRAKIESITL